MVRLLKLTGKYCLVFLLTITFLFLLLFLTAKIPNSRILPNWKLTADYLYEKPLYDYRVNDAVYSSEIDYYADSVLLSVAYYMGEGIPVESIMWAKYYGYHNQFATHYLTETVSNNTSPNNEYLRYWHGSAGLIRILHLFWNIKTIYIFHAILTAGFFILLTILLIKEGMFPEALVFTLSMIIVSVWYVPRCLEYTWMFLVMLVAAIISVRLSLKRKNKNIGIFFLVTGMVAAYLDFLTTETLTLLIPLLFILRIGSRQGEEKNWPVAIKSSISWGIGFVGMWVSKWILSSVILGIDAMPYVTEHIGERLAGNGGLTTGEYIVSAIIKNLKCLFPYEYGIYGAALVLLFIILVVIIPVMRDKIVLKQSINKSVIPVYATLSLIPFIRFAVLRNHSYIHYFFTHRALASTILALCFIALECIERNKQRSCQYHLKQGS